MGGHLAALRLVIPVFLASNAKRMARDETAKAFDVAPGDIITVGERFF